MEIWLVCLLPVGRLHESSDMKLKPEILALTLELQLRWHFFHSAGGKIVSLATFMGKAEMLLNFLRDKKL
jgi:hypothetical protein